MTVLSTVQSLIPHGAKSSPSGWISFNAPCCHHRGHKPDNRKRAGIKFDDGFIYNCFNCKYTAGWKPGSSISVKTKQLCKWLGADDDIIKSMVFDALKTETATNTENNIEVKIDFEKKNLPKGAKSINSWLSDELDSTTSDSIEAVVKYIIDRGFNPLDNMFYWALESGFENRVILPFTFQNRIVGYTARKVTPGKPKYLSDQHSNFVFNVDNIKPEQQYLFVVEGPFDALSINGVALLTNNISKQHARIINSLNKKVIVIPDQDEAGVRLIDQAIDQGWSVAFPNWDDKVKDCADAVNKYGKLFVTVDAILSAQHTKVKIELEKKQTIKKLKSEREDI